MAVEVRARQPAVPRPLVLGVGGRMHTDVSATRLDVALQDVLLRRVQHIARSTQKDHGAVASQVFLSKGSGILGRVDRKAIFLSQFPDRRDAVGDGAMAKGCRLGKDEHAWLL